MAELSDKIIAIDQKASDTLRNSEHFCEQCIQKADREYTKIVDEYKKKVSEIRDQKLQETHKELEALKEEKEKALKIRIEHTRSNIQKEQIIESIFHVIKVEVCP